MGQSTVIMHVNTVNLQVECSHSLPIKVYNMFSSFITAGSFISQTPVLLFYI